MRSARDARVRSARRGRMCPAPLSRPLELDPGGAMLRSLLGGAASKLGRAAARLLDQDRDDPAVTIGQVALRLHYQELARAGGPLPSFRDVGFRVNSQSDEDGILLFLFAILEMSGRDAGVDPSTSRRCVELGAGDGRECNTANLILRRGWTGLLLDGDPRNVRHARDFYGRHRATWINPPRCEHAWLTRATVNETLAKYGFDDALDLLSIDLDGVDYWIWEALTVARPRVVVVEYQDLLGPERAWTVPYADDFRASSFQTAAGPRSSTSIGPNDFAGASLRAWVDLGRRKGYRLVGCNTLGYNAFFVRDGLAETLLPEVSAASCHSHPRVIASMRDRFPKVAHLPWVDVASSPETPGVPDTHLEVSG
ncbi:MAG: hypothetical protein KGM43_00955 [Planctomycetota bacterium]|nr:hypothetical protein [Planctomycetota bacterium]